MTEVSNKQNIITGYQTHEKDTGSCDVQIALLTAHEKMCFGKKANEAEADSPDARAGYRDLKKMIYRGYYHSEIGCTQELQYELIPGADARIDAPLAEIGRSWAL